MSVLLPKSNIHLVGSGLDKNGNKIIKLEISSMGRGFSIQSLGNLPQTHRILYGKKTAKDMEGISKSDLAAISKEVVGYVSEFGSTAQKAKLRKS